MDEQYYDYKVKLVKQLETDDCVVFVRELYERDKGRTNDEFRLSGESETIVLHHNKLEWVAYIFKGYDYSFDYKNIKRDLTFEIDKALSGKDIKDIEKKIKFRYFAEAI